MPDINPESCPTRDDGTHCVHWWDGEQCCSCKASAMTDDEKREQGMLDDGVELGGEG